MTTRSARRAQERGLSEHQDDERQRSVTGWRRPELLPRIAGFDPKTIDAKPGETVTLDWWNTDAAMHPQGASPPSSLQPTEVFP